MNNCNCNSQWVKNAKKYLKQNSIDEKYYTIEYLLKNEKCGNSRSTIYEIINHLKNKNISLSRENFQHKVLIPLKKNSILATLIYPGRTGGVFIPCHKDQIKKAYHQVLKRVKSELSNINDVVQSSNIDNSLSKIIDIIQKEINNLN